MSNARYRWVIVAAGGALGCVAIGAMFSLPVFLLPISRDTGWSVTGVSTALTIAFLAMAVGSIGWGSLSDRLGARVTALIGSVGLAVSLAIVSRVTSLLLFQILFGVLVGGATAAIFAPLMACVTRWFDTQRGLAVSLVSAGMGMAPMTMSPFAAWLITRHDWRTSMLIISVVVAVVMIPAALLIRTPPDQAAEAEVPPAGAGEAMTFAQVAKSPPFIILCLTNFFCCATHAGPIIHTVSNAITCGIPMVAAVTIYSVEGLAGMGGRIAFGLMGDRFGAHRVLVTGLLLQAFAALAYFFVRELGAFYAVAALFGFIYAGTMPLYAVLARESFPPRMMGAVIGGTAMAGSLGMATGPIAGGLIYDHFGSYGWMYIGAWVLGLGAFAMALLFRPAARGESAAVSGA